MSAPPPLLVHEGPWVTVFIYTHKGDTVNFLTLLASGQRGFGSRCQSLAKLFHIQRGGHNEACCMAVESSSRWQSSSVLLGAEMPFAVVPASLVQRAEHSM